MRIALTLDGDALRRETNDYLRALMEAGARREEIVLLAPGDLPPEDFDGVVLGGGGDVDPVRYGQAPRPDAKVEVDAGRDRTDFALFEEAWRRDAPILGICRGLQVINVALGGTLVQDIPSQRPSQVVHEAPRAEKTRRDHPVAVAPGSRLEAIAGGESMRVNSRHHQAIDATAAGLDVTGTAPDGTIEAVEGSDGRWLLGVQWHPENLAGDEPSERLFDSFVRAARERARSRES